jgi:hypothetical protein
VNAGGKVIDIRCAIAATEKQARAQVLGRQVGRSAGDGDWESSDSRSPPLTIVRAVRRVQAFRSAGLAYYYRRVTIGARRHDRGDCGHRCSHSAIWSMKSFGHGLAVLFVPGVQALSLSSVRRCIRQVSAAGCRGRVAGQYRRRRMCADVLSVGAIASHRVRTSCGCSAR